jgi:PAP2 superfamily
MLNNLEIPDISWSCVDKMFAEIKQACLVFLLAGSSIAFADECTVQDRSFSRSQVLDDHYRTIADKSSENPLYDKIQHAIAEPPQLGSPQFCEELAELRHLSLLQEKYEIDIRCEVSIDCYNIGGFVVGSEVNQQKRRITLKLIALSLSFLEPILFSLKIRYDRVRPSYADPTLKPVIKVPDHPSYPSGHAAEAMLIAEILSLLQPERRNYYVLDAERIAKNREIAGLHYKSDSVAGNQLAREFFHELKSKRWFVEISKRAKSEWISDPITVP